MRQEFWKLLYEAMEKNPDIWCLVGDLGYGGADKIRDDFPDRFYNCGASEFAMVGIACGLALEGKTVFIYTISSFYLRAAEIIATYIDAEKIPVIMVGSGRDKNYLEDGRSHWAMNAQNFLNSLPNIRCAYPDSKEEAEKEFSEIIKNKQPVFLSLIR